MVTGRDAAERPGIDPDAHAFRRNLLIVGLVHVVALVTVFLASKLQAKRPTPQLMWLDGGALAATGGSADETRESVSSEQESARESAPIEVPAPHEAPSPPVERPVPSEIVLPRATPEPTPVRVTPKPAPAKPATPKPATPKPETPRAKATPRPSPKTTPRNSPKPSPQKTASPKPEISSTAKAKATPVESKSAGNGAATLASAAKAGTGSNTGTGKGPGKIGGGASTGPNEFAWYYEMLDDRFTSRWEQPLSIVRSAQQFVTMLTIRINKDGTIVSREIASSSGNPVMDESVLAAARKVLVVDPLPAGLGGQTFDVNINFTLDQGQ